MSPTDSSNLRVDRTQFAVCDSFGEAARADRDYWRSRTPGERLAALEVLRRIAYGHDRTTARLERVLEIAEREGR